MTALSLQPYTGTVAWTKISGLGGSYDLAVPIEMNLWRVEDDRPPPLVATGIDEERRLESILAGDISTLGLGALKLLGRQVITDHGARVDLLALDEAERYTSSNSSGPARRSRLWRRSWTMDPGHAA